MIEGRKHSKLVDRTRAGRASPHMKRNKCLSDQFFRSLAFLSNAALSPFIGAPYRSVAIHGRKLIRSAASCSAVKIAAVERALLQVKPVRQRKPMSKPARLAAPMTKVKTTSTGV